MVGTSNLGSWSCHWIYSVVSRIDTTLRRRSDISVRWQKVDSRPSQAVPGQRPKWLAMEWQLMEWQLYYIYYKILYCIIKHYIMYYNTIYYLYNIMYYNNYIYNIIYIYHINLWWPLSRHLVITRLVLINYNPQLHPQVSSKNIACQ